MSLSITVRLPVSPHPPLSPFLSIPAQSFIRALNWPSHRYPSVHPFIQLSPVRAVGAAWGRVLVGYCRRPPLPSPLSPGSGPLSWTLFFLFFFRPPPDCHPTTAHCQSEGAFFPPTGGKQGGDGLALGSKLWVVRINFTMIVQ